MPSCCYGDEYGEVFTEREASRAARRVRRRGLDGNARELADALIASGIQDATVLEVGGGVGHLHTHLLRAGAARATNVELSPSWETAAQELVVELGLQGRVDRRLGDICDEAAELPAADTVILHRVVCCYPHWRAMIDAASSLSRRAIGITLPVDRWWTRGLIGVGNRIVRLRGRDFRAYVHPADDVVARVVRDGFQVTHDRERLFWRTVVLVRAA